MPIWLSSNSPESAFEIQFPGENLPFTLQPGNDNIGAIMKDWASDEDKEFFSDMYPRVTPGTGIASINGVATTILDYEAIMKLMDEGQGSRHICLWNGGPEWEIVRARLSYIAKNMSKQRGGTSKEAQELSRRAHEALLLYIRQGNEKYIRKQLAQVTNIDFPPLPLCAQLYPKTILEHLHIDLPSNTIASKADWLQFWYQPSISQYIDEKTKAGKRILIACYDGTNIGPAILSTFLMTRRGYERKGQVAIF